MNLSQAQDERRARGAMSFDQRAEEVVDLLCEKVELSNADRVGPGARKKLRGILDHYRKMAHPFTACVRDNTKRFGPERAKKVCAVLTDLEKGTTKWRSGGRKKSTAMSLAQDQSLDPVTEMDDELFSLLERISRTDYKAALGLEEATT